MNIADINNNLENIGKPAAKAPAAPANSNPNASALKVRKYPLDSAPEEIKKS